jgi:hypothetical protein
MTLPAIITFRRSIGVLLWVVDSRCSKLTRFVTKSVIDHSLNDIRQALDDLPAPTNEDERLYQEKCKKLLLRWRKNLRRERDKLMAGVED